MENCEECKEKDKRIEKLEDLLKTLENAIDEWQSEMRDILRNF